MRRCSSSSARARAVPVWSEIELGARLLPNPILGVTGTNGKTTTTELLGAVFRVRRHARRGRRQRRPSAHVSRRVGLAGGVGRLRALVVPARRRRDAASARRRPAQPRARPPRPARLIRGVCGREAPHLRAAGCGGHGGRPTRIRLDPRRSASSQLCSGRRASRRAARPRPAQPRERRRGDRRGSCCGDRRRGHRRRAAHVRGRPHRIELVRELRGTRYVNDSKATNVAATLRALASFPDAPLHVIIGGRGKHESYAPLGAAFKDGDTATSSARRQTRSRRRSA